MKILAITYCFVPLQFPATFRLLKWLKYLSEMGHEVTLLSVDPASFNGPKDPNLACLVPEHVDNIQVTSWENTPLFRLLRRCEPWLISLFQPGKKEWFGPARRAGCKALSLREYDLIFTCSQPPVCHLLGREIKRETNLPWVTYFSDPWIELRFTESSPRE